MLINYDASSTCQPPFQPALQHVLGVFSVLSCPSDLGLQTQSPAEQACALLAAHKQPFFVSAAPLTFDYACPSALPAQEWPHVLITDCLCIASLSHDQEHDHLPSANTEKNNYTTEPARYRNNAIKNLSSEQMIKKTNKTKKNPLTYEAEVENDTNVFPSVQLHLQAQLSKFEILYHKNYKLVYHSYVRAPRQRVCQFLL